MSNVSYMPTVLSPDEIVSAERAARANDVEVARAHPYFGRLRPRAGRLLMTRPHRRVSEFRTSANGLVMAARSTRDMAEWGFEATVLAVGADCGDDLAPGMRILLPQFAGIPLLDLETGAGVDLWIVGIGEILAVVTDNDERVACPSCGAAIPCEYRAPLTLAP